LAGLYAFLRFQDSEIIGGIYLVNQLEMVERLRSYPRVNIGNPERNFRKKNQRNRRRRIPNRLEANWGKLKRDFMDNTLSKKRKSCVPPHLPASTERRVGKVPNRGREEITPDAQKKPISHPHNCWKGIPLRFFEREEESLRREVLSNKISRGKGGENKGGQSLKIVMSRFNRLPGGRRRNRRDALLSKKFSSEDIEILERLVCSGPQRRCTGHPPKERRDNRGGMSWVGQPHHQVNEKMVLP